MALASPANATAPMFQQQGQVDWIALSKSVIQLSVEAYARLSKAGVEALTLEIGRGLCHSFLLQPASQERIIDAISKLQKHSGYKNLLWFGFGLKSVSEDLATTEQGLTLCALCGSLSAAYEPALVARILRELCVKADVPRNLRPSISQWRALVDLLGGTLMSSEFTITLEGFQRIIAPKRPFSRHSLINRCSSASELGDVILALARISNSKLSSVTITGGFDCSWLAAFAQWVLALSVEVRNSTSTIYRSGDAAQAAQVIFHIITPSSDKTYGAGTVVTGKSYMLSSGRDLIYATDNQEFSFITRSPWGTILFDTFGDDIEHFHSTCGSAFNVYLNCLVTLGPDFTLSKLEKGFSADYNKKSPPLYWAVSPFLWSNPKSRGSQFFDFARTRLPELEGYTKFLPKMKSQEADKLISQCRLLFHMYCHCSLHNNKDEADRSDICMCLLADTILVFLWINIISSIDGSIMPSSSGLKTLYGWVLRGMYPFWAEHKGDGIADLIQSKFGWTSGPFLDLEIVFAVFAGSKSKINDMSGGEDQYGNLAVCDAGICAYSHFLDRPWSTFLETSHYRIVPGHISHEGSLYLLVKQRSPGWTTSPQDIDSLRHTLHNRLEITAIAEELDNTCFLTFAYQITHPFYNRPFLFNLRDLRVYSEYRPLLQAEHHCKTIHRPYPGCSVLTLPDRIKGSQHYLDPISVTLIEKKLNANILSNPGQWMMVAWNYEEGTTDLKGMRAHPENNASAVDIICGHLLPLYFLLLTARDRNMRHFMQYSNCVACVLEQACEFIEYLGSRSLYQLNKPQYGSHIPGSIRFHFPDGSTLEAPWQIQQEGLSPEKILPPPNPTSSK
ncbi:MAG: hypothetical protein M1814_006074 [Vezdaea aestivalis]|nr:MAG: hypothetical protein M1814_006074 [Vezdaea aestivalis]